MKILILGGTQFVGRHIAEAAINDGHTITLFHRGVTNPGLFPDVQHILGDRDTDLDRLRGHRWDAVIDVSGCVPQSVGEAARSLKEATPFYAFISTISVYADMSHRDQDEEAPLATVQEQGATYGPLKALCEQEVRGQFGDDALVVRPGLVTGPFDPTDRFTYWPVRADHGGEMLAPGNPHGCIRHIDARDLAAWVVSMTARHKPGTYNAATADPELTMQALLEESIAAARTDTHLTWVDEQAVLAQGLVPWSDLPLWLPTETTDEYCGYVTHRVDRAVAQSLAFRPLSATVRDTLAWARETGRTLPLKAGLTREREQQALMAWHAQIAGMKE